MVGVPAGVEVVAFNDVAFDDVLVDDLVVVAANVETADDVEEAAETLPLTVTAVLVSWIVGEVVVEFVVGTGTLVVVVSDTVELDSVSGQM